VKRVFDLLGAAPLPYQDLSPKKQLEMLQRNMPEGEQISLYDARMLLASSFDLDKVAERCTDFADLRKQLFVRMKAI
jgi:hypothetical protein